MADDVTPYMGLTEPEPGGDSDTWGSIVNANSEILDSHDHSPGKGTPVIVAGINIDDDLDFNGNAAIDLGGVQFTTGASIGINSVWVRTSTGDLYYTNSSGSDVQITAGSALDLSVVGGITGDYAAASASFYYDQTNKTYRALQAAPLPNNWASLSAGDVDLYEKTSGSTNHVRLKSPVALAASYNVTFPAALPASTSVVTMSSSGVLANTRDPSVDTLTTTGDITVGGEVNASGAMTADDFYFTVAQQLMIPASAAQLASGSSFSSASDVAIALSTSTDPCVFPVLLPIGMEIATVTVFIVKGTDNTKTVTATLHTYRMVDGAATDPASGSDSENAVTYTSFGMGTVNYTILSGYAYSVLVTGSGTNGDFIQGVRLTYTRPHP